MDFFSILKAGTTFKPSKTSYALEKSSVNTLVNSAVKSSVNTLVNSAVKSSVNTLVNSAVKSSVNTLVKSLDTDIKVPTKETKETPLEEIKSEKEAQECRKQSGIKIYGSDVKYPIRSFSHLQLKPYLLKNITESHSTPTPIQMQAIPVIMSKRDLIACAPTGSGKTLAFCIPLLALLKNPEKVGFRALIITPTKELAEQIYRELSKLIKGKPFKVCVLSKSNLNNKQQLKQYDIIISTPLRLVHALKQETLSLNNVSNIILDEADKLLDLGFLDQVDDIFSACTCSSIQKSLFSATIPSGVEQLANSFMFDAVRVVVGVKNAATDTIKQELLYVGEEQGKLLAMRQLITNGLPLPCLIFVQSIERAKELFHELVYENINVDVIHSDRTESQRHSIIKNFRLGKTWVLISTELLSRGLDFKCVNLVINYDFPQSGASYVHRIGRTGRAGRPGSAITFFTKQDGEYLKTIVNVMRQSGCEVPEWMLKLKAPSRNEKKILKTRGVVRDGISTRAKWDLEKMKKRKGAVEASKRKKVKVE